MPDEAAGRLRCFVGLWPDEAAAERLDTICRDLQREFAHARRVPRANLHLTLAFIGDLDVDRARRLAADVTALAVDPFDWIIDRLDRFAGPRVIWAGGDVPIALAQLVLRVEALLVAHCVTFDRRPYRPHVTLLRHAPPGALAGGRAVDPPIAWPVQQPRLLHSASGHYAAVLARD